MRKDDLIRIRHMLDAAKEAISFIKDKENMRGHNLRGQVSTGCCSKAQFKNI